MMTRSIAGDVQTASDAESEALADRHLAYLLLRLALGGAMLMHGVVRVFVIGSVAFGNGMARQMAHTPLPLPLVRLFGTVLPLGEFALGLALVMGLWTRRALAAGVLLMLALIFGSGLNNDWQGVGTQLTYAALFCALLGLRRYNASSLDALLERRARRGEASERQSA